MRRGEIIKIAKTLVQYSKDVEIGECYISMTEPAIARSIVVVEAFPETYEVTVEEQTNTVTLKKVECSYELNTFKNGLKRLADLREGDRFIRHNDDTVWIYIRRWAFQDPFIDMSDLYGHIVKDAYHNIHVIQDPYIIQI